MKVEGREEVLGRMVRRAAVVPLGWTVDVVVSCPAAPPTREGTSGSIPWSSSPKMGLTNQH